MRTQTNKDFYKVFFFKSNPKQREFQWERIIDTEATLSFPVETVLWLYSASVWNTALWVGVARSTPNVCVCV